MEAIELDDSLEIVRTALDHSPRVLILGQYYLGRTCADNPLFAALDAALGTGIDLYTWWVSATSTVSERAKLLRNIEDAVTVHEQIVDLLGLQWTAVFTSAIDSTTRGLLRIQDSREVHQIYTPAGEHGNAGSIRLFRLFGSVDRPDREELPPAGGEVEIRRRRKMASSILDCLPEIVAGGNLFISGWRAGLDWLRPREVAQALATLGKEQVYLFDVDDAALDEAKRDEDLNELIESRVVIPIRPSLADVVEKLTDTGWAGVRDERRENVTQVLYQVVGSRPTQRSVPSVKDLVTVVFPRIEWRRLSDGKAIFTDLDGTRDLPESPTGLSEAYRAFAGGDIQWDWLPHLALHRRGLDDLIQECWEILQSPNPEAHTIVIYGQSGSGKSVLLRLLALELRKMGLPVIFSGPSILPVSREHLEAFCEAVSSVSSSPVFFVHDGNRDDSEYLELSSYMASRARACVVVGSSYPAQRVAVRPRRGKSSQILHQVELSVKLNGSEAEGLLAHVERFTTLSQQRNETLRCFLNQDASNFFALIYRLLPDSRPQRRRGIIAEFTDSSRKIQERIETLAKEPPKPDLTVMGTALQKALGAYLFDRYQETTESDKSRSADDSGDALRLINAVMVVSQLGLQVPQSLALRLVGQNIAAYRSSVKGDIIDVREARECLSTLQARHALEANIWVSERLPRLEDQFALIRQLVKQIRESEINDDQAIELEFAAQVLRALGPQGQERVRKPQLYLEIAALVAELRALHGDVHPRLLLIESNAIREGIKSEQGRASTTDRREDRRKLLDEWVRRLESAEDGLRIAQEIVLKQADGFLTQGARRMLATLATERAGVIGFMIGSLHRTLPAEVRQRPEWTVRADQWLCDARASWREALAYDDSSVPAIDTACWTFAERCNVGGLTTEQEAELFAAWSEMIDRFNEHDTLSPSQLDGRDRREAEFSERIGNVTRFTTVTERAAKRGSHAVHALMARWIEKDSGAAAAREYLRVNCDAARFQTANANIDPTEDRVVLLLYSRLWWRSETGFDSYFPEERVCLKFSREQWEQLLHLCEARLSLEGEREHSTSLFFRACGLFHLRRIDAGEKIFEHLDRLGVGGIRRSRALVLMTDEMGKPRQFTAEFQGRRRGERFLAWCDDLGTHVPFGPLELVGPGDIRAGQRIGPFHLSFRFRGAYAEPIRRLAWHRKNIGADGLK